MEAVFSHTGLCGMRPAPELLRVRPCLLWLAWQVDIPIYRSCDYLLPHMSHAMPGLENCWTLSYVIPLLKLSLEAAPSNLALHHYSITKTATTLFTSLHDDFVSNCLTPQSYEQYFILGREDLRENQEKRDESGWAQIFPSLYERQCYSIGYTRPYKEHWTISAYILSFYYEALRSQIILDGHSLT